MKKIGGNITAVFQVKTEGEKNIIGERQETWEEKLRVVGWLDLSSGDSRRTTYYAKVQESTHTFLCDYQPLVYQSAGQPEQTVDITEENARVVINNRVYDIMLIDDPMNLHQHLEIYLKYVGGQNG